MSEDIELLSINTIRFLAVDAVQKANSGHPGMPMGCAPIAYTLYKNYINHNNKPVLIITPLAVAFQFIKEAENSKPGISIKTKLKLGKS